MTPYKYYDYCGWNWSAYEPKKIRRGFREPKSGKHRKQLKTH